MMVALTAGMVAGTLLGFFVGSIIGRTLARARAIRWAWETCQRVQNQPFSASLWDRLLVEPSAATAAKQTAATWTPITGHPGVNERAWITRVCRLVTRWGLDPAVHIEVRRPARLSFWQRFKAARRGPASLEIVVRI